MVRLGESPQRHVRTGVTENKNICTSKMHSHYKAYFLFHAHVQTSSASQVQRNTCCGICCCWKRSTSKNRLSAKKSWQTSSEMSCHSTNSCHTHCSNEAPLPQSPAPAAPSLLMSSHSLIWHRNKQVLECTSTLLYMLTHARMWAYTHTLWSRTWI